MTSHTALDLASVAQLSDRLTADYLEFNAVLPLRVQGGRVDVATWMPEVDPQVVDDLRFVFDAEVDIVSGPEADLRAAIRRVYGDDSITAQGLIAGLGAERAEQSPRPDVALDDLVHLANEAPVVRLVNLLLLEALEARASDVHLEGYADELRVRYRIDGVLQDGPAPPAHLAAAIVSRLKIMADLDIAERRVPQDGRIRLRLQDRPVDVRVSTVPVLHGESIVMALSWLPGRRARARRRRCTRRSITFGRGARRSLLSRTRSSMSSWAYHRFPCGRRSASRSRPRCVRCCGRIPMSYWWAKSAIRRPRKSPPTRP